MGIDRANIRIQRFFSEKWWLLPAIVSLVTFISEYIDHHHEGDLLRNSEFLREALIFSVLFPIILSVIIYYLREAFIQRDTLTTELDLLLSFSKDLSRVDSWDHLLLSIENYLNNFIPAENYYLGVYNPDQKTYQMVAKWSAESLDVIVPEPNFSEIASQLRLPAQHQDTSDLDEVFLFPTVCPDEYEGRICLPLSFGEGVFAVLIFDLTETNRLGNAQINAISSILPEITMAAVHVYSMEFNIDQNQSRQSERRRIARILHDTLAQDISYLRLKLELLQEQDSLIGIIEVQRDLERMQQVAQNAVSQVRDTLDSLVTDMPNDISYAIRTTAESICSPAEIKVNISNSGSPQALPVESKRKIINIVREAISNVEKHSGVSEVDINLKWCEDQFLLEVEDSGKGFSPEECFKEQHYGMIFMHERAESIGADLQIVSFYDEGTKVILTLPLPVQGEG